MEITQDDNKTAAHIEYRHDRHHHRRYLRNAPDAAHDDQKCEYSKDYSHLYLGQTKSGSERCSDRITLRHISDTKRSKHRKKGKAAA